MPKKNWEVLRAQAVSLRKNNYTFRDISTTLNVSIGFTVKAHQRFNKNKTYSALRRSGRPRKTSKREDRKIERICLQNRRLTAPEIRRRVRFFKVLIKKINLNKQYFIIY